MQQPTIGRIVHIELPPLTVPAIVTAVTSSDGEISATVLPPGLPPGPIEGVQHVEPADGQYPAGTWHWPPAFRP